jgi:hypothetical protein
MTVDTTRDECGEDGRSTRNRSNLYLFFYCAADEDKSRIRNPGSTSIRYECDMFPFFQEFDDLLYFRES